MHATHELTLKQILDSGWVRRIGRVAVIITPILMSAGGGFVGWLIHTNNETSAKAATIATAAVALAEDLRHKNDERAMLADARAADQKAWQDSLDSGLIRLGQRVTNEFSTVNEKFSEIAGDIGELKGLIVRQSASAGDGVAAPFPARLFHTP